MSHMSTGTDLLAAIDGGQGDAVIAALNKLHAQKVRSLMRSISELQAKLAKETAQAKPHRQSAMIQVMRTKQREGDLVVDVLKEEVAQLKKLTPEEVNDFVIRKTLGGPLRFRPKTREELQNELSLLEKKHNRMLAKMKQQGDAKRPGGTGSRISNMNNNQNNHENDGVEGDLAIDVSPYGNPVRQELSTTAGGGGMGELSAMMEELEQLRVAVRSRDMTIQAQKDELESRRAEGRQVLELEERLAHKERRSKEAKAKNASLWEHLSALVAKHEAVLEDVNHLKAQLQLQEEESKIEADSLKAQVLKSAEELDAALRRETLIRTDGERAELLSAQGRREAHHTARMEGKALEEANAALKESEKRYKRLADTSEKLTAEVTRLGKEAAQTETFRERTRMLNLEMKALQKRCDDIQAKYEAEVIKVEHEKALRIAKEASDATALMLKQAQVQQEKDTTSKAAPATDKPGAVSRPSSPNSTVQQIPLTVDEKSPTHVEELIQKCHTLSFETPEQKSVVSAMETLLLSQTAQLTALYTQRSLVSDEGEDSAAEQLRKTINENEELRKALAEFQNQVTAARVVTSRLSIQAATTDENRHKIDELQADLASVEAQKASALRVTEQLKIDLGLAKVEADVYRRRYEEAAKSAAEVLGGDVAVTDACETLLAGLRELETAAGTKLKSLESELTQLRARLETSSTKLEETLSYVQVLEDRLVTLGYEPVGMMEDEEGS